MDPRLPGFLLLPPTGGRCGFLTIRAESPGPAGLVICRVHISKGRAWFVQTAQGLVLMIIRGLATWEDNLQDALSVIKILPRPISTFDQQGTALWS